MMHTRHARYKPFDSQNWLNYCLRKSDLHFASGSSFNWQTISRPRSDWTSVFGHQLQSHFRVLFLPLPASQYRSYSLVWNSVRALLFHSCSVHSCHARNRKFPTSSLIVVWHQYVFLVPTIFWQIYWNSNNLKFRTIGLLFNIDLHAKSIVSTTERLCIYFGAGDRWQFIGSDGPIIRLCCSK